jgi:putative hydrolase of the HAD superfamily
LRTGVPDLRVVVFDIDDTLYLESTYVASGFRSVGRVIDERYGVSGSSDVMWQLFLEGVRGSIFDVALEKLGLDHGPHLVAELVDVYRNHQPDIAALPDAEECFAALAGRVDIAVITDGPAASQRAKVVALGLERVASLVVVTDQLGEGRGKPAHDAYVLVEKHFSVRPDQCAYVADNPLKDFVAPLERGWSVVRVRREGGLHQKLKHEGQLLETSGLGDVARLLGLS